MRSTLILPMKVDENIFYEPGVFLMTIVCDIKIDLLRVTSLCQFFSVNLLHSQAV